MIRRCPSSPILSLGGGSRCGRRAEQCSVRLLNRTERRRCASRRRFRNKRCCTQSAHTPDPGGSCRSTRTPQRPGCRRVDRPKARNRPNTRGLRSRCRPRHLFHNRRCRHSQKRGRTTPHTCVAAHSPSSFASRSSPRSPRRAGSRARESNSRSNAQSPTTTGEGERSAASAALTCGRAATAACGTFTRARCTRPRLQSRPEARRRSLARARVSRRIQ